MVKKCDKELNKINEYLDKKLDLKKKGLSYIDVELERHVTNCGSCREEMEDQQNLFDALAEIDLIEPPPDFTEQLMARLPQPNKPKLPRWLLASGAALLSASSTVLFLVVFFLLRNTSQMDFLKSISNSVLTEVWEFTKYVAVNVFDFTKVIIGVLQAIWSLIAAYPLYSITLVLLGILLSIVMIRLINDFQNQNFA